MDLLKSIIMGIVQGIAEFLPISSDGHLALMKHILHIQTDTGILFDVLLHFGTLIAIVIVFWKDVLELIVEGLKIVGDFILNIVTFFKNLGTKNRTQYKNVISTPYRRFVMLILVSTIPTGIIGVVFDTAVEIAGQTLLVPGLCLILTGLLLLIADRTKLGKKTEETVTYKDAGLIGIAQGLAVLPGLSRSGSTLTASLLLGFDKNFAVKYSFIMSIPAVLGAVIFKLKDFSSYDVTQAQMLNYLVGMLVAAFVGIFAIKTMLMVVRGKKFKYFAYYCFAIGAIAVISYFII